MRGVIRIPRSIKRWNPVVHWTGKAYRATVFHPKDKSISGQSLNANPSVALHEAQVRCRETYDESLRERLAEERALRGVSGVTYSA